MSRISRRRHVLSVAAGLGTLVVLAGCGTSSTASSTASSARQTVSAARAQPAASTNPAKPNIVFVLTDDLSRNLIRHMPAVQRMQKTGMTMSKYDVVDSLCCPSRSAIFTGEYPHDDGVFTNMGTDGGYGAYQAHHDAKKSFAVALQKRGYKTGFMGKYLNGYQPTDPIPPGWGTWDVAGNGYPEFNYNLNENGTVVHYGKQPKDFLVDVLSQKAGAFITSSGHSPFMLEVATFAPHAPYTPAPRYVGASHAPYPKTPAYDTLPKHPPSWLAGRPALTQAQETKLRKAYDKRIDADLAVNDLINHIESTLESAGVAKNTYLVFSSDNGYHMGEYRLLAGKQTAFDTDIHVPLVVVGPHVPAGGVSNQFATNIDIAPTFEHLTGATTGSDVDGRSLAPLWHGQHGKNWQQAVLVEHHGPDNQPGDPDRQNQAHADPPSYEAIRTADALFVKYSNGDLEYYRTDRDPYELNNIAAKGVPKYLQRALGKLESCHGEKSCQAAAQLH